LEVQQKQIRGRWFACYHGSGSIVNMQCHLI